MVEVYLVSWGKVAERRNARFVFVERHFFLALVLLTRDDFRLCQFNTLLEQEGIAQFVPDKVETGS